MLRCQTHIASNVIRIDRMSRVAVSAEKNSKGPRTLSTSMP